MCAVQIPDGSAGHVQVGLDAAVFNEGTVLEQVAEGVASEGAALPTMMPTAVSGSSRPRQFRSVDLPDPLRLRTAIISPLLMVVSRSFQSIW